MKILIGSCVKQVPEVLRAHLNTLMNQTGGHDISFAFIDDCDDMESKLMLPGFVMTAERKPDRAHYAVDETTHRWSIEMFGWLGRQKQRLIDYAKKQDFDAIFLVDSDLLCAPDTLSSLVNTKKDVVSAVFWTKWVPDAPAQPQVWLQHPYGLKGRGLEEHEFVGRLANRKLERVHGLGACTLIRKHVFDKVAYWPFVEGLPTEGMWQGEDRHFCITAERNHVELWADAWPDVWHCYRPSDRSQIDVVYDDLFGYKLPCVEIGDLVSAQIQPLEEQQLSGYVEHVRGRLGQLKILPDVEKALLTMNVGESRIVKVKFPPWYEIAAYRGQTRLLKVTLLSAKPFAYAPTLDNDVQEAA